MLFPKPSKLHGILEAFFKEAIGPLGEKVAVTVEWNGHRARSVLIAVDIQYHNVRGVEVASCDGKPSTVDDVLRMSFDQNLAGLGGGDNVFPNVSLRARVQVHLRLLQY